MSKKKSSDRTQRKFEFTGCFIPAEVMYMLQDGDISPREVLLLATIDALDKRSKFGKEGCYASNEWLANMLGLGGVRSVANMLGKLYKSGMVKQTNASGKRRRLRVTWGTERESDE